MASGSTINSIEKCLSDFVKVYLESIAREISPWKMVFPPRMGFPTLYPWYHLYYKLIPTGTERLNEVIWAVLYVNEVNVFEGVYIDVEQSICRQEDSPKFISGLYIMLRKGVQRVIGLSCDGFARNI